MLNFLLKSKLHRSFLNNVIYYMNHSHPLHTLLSLNLLLFFPVSSVLSPRSIFSVLSPYTVSSLCLLFPVASVLSPRSVFSVLSPYTVSSLCLLCPVFSALSPRSVSSVLSPLCLLCPISSYCLLCPVSSFCLLLLLSILYQAEDRGVLQHYHTPGLRRHALRDPQTHRA